MALREAVAALAAENQSPQCGLGKILATLPADELEEYEQLRAEGTSGERIAAGFRRIGKPVSGQVVRHHWNGICSCPR